MYLHQADSELVNAPKIEKMQSRQRGYGKHYKSAYLIVSGPEVSGTENA